MPCVSTAFAPKTVPFLAAHQVGYGDNLNCYMTIHANEGERVRLSFTQLNLEGPGTQPGCMPCTDPRGAILSDSASVSADVWRGAVCAAS